MQQPSVSDLLASCSPALSHSLFHKALVRTGGCLHPLPAERENELPSCNSGGSQVANNDDRDPPGP
jgi:hypothetical protein